MLCVCFTIPGVVCEQITMLSLGLSVLIARQQRIPRIFCTVSMTARCIRGDINWAIRTRESANAVQFFFVSALILCWLYQCSRELKCLSGGNSELLSPYEVDVSALILAGIRLVQFSEKSNRMPSDVTRHFSKRVGFHNDFPRSLGS